MTLRLMNTLYFKCATLDYNITINIFEILLEYKLNNEFSALLDVI